LGRYEFTGYLTGIGILLFIVQISYNTFRAIKIMIQNEKESEILKKLAYKDILTNMGNRAAFEEYVDGLRKSNDTKSFRLAMMDINNLKHINDNYGHREGDEAIKACSGAIGKYLQPHGECFRLGGDEFACVIFDLEDGAFESQVKMMREELKERKSDHEYMLDIAIGSDVYDFNRHNDIGDFIHQTDLKMYSNKKRIKERGYGTV
jgi:diguanylate cyclase (GGDEF)-like protein